MCRSRFSHHACYVELAINCADQTIASKCINGFESVFLRTCRSYDNKRAKRYVLPIRISYLGSKDACTYVYIIGATF